VIVEIDPTYEPEEMETREVFGVTFEQKRNTVVLNHDLLKNIPTSNRTLPESAKQDLLVALATLKYTQSNSICLTLDGQSIGIGAGQQSRIHCTRLATTKAAMWYLRQHPTVLQLRWRKGIRRPEQVNAIDQFLRDDVTLAEKEYWSEVFEEIPQPLSAQEKREWLMGLQGIALGSDGYIPFRDTIDCAAQYGVAYVVQPGASLRDQNVIDACNTYGMVMAFSGVRLFHH
jgi:phosphoribosylaminoimidazolecarboxamide formyltransferase / IMP cyclohydrolase